MRAVRKRLAVGALMLSAAGGAVALAPPRDDGPAVCPAACVAPAAATLDAPARPESAVALDWAGPPAATLGKPAEYTLSVRNLSAQPAQKTVVQVRPPRDASVQQTSPAAKVVDGVYVWDLGTLDPRSATHLKLTMTPTARGEMGSQAWVTFTGTAGMTVAVREPKVVVKVSAPEAVTVGDTFKVTYTVKNVGDAPAENVRHALTRFSAPLDLNVDFKKLAALQPGEEWTETAEVTADKGGRMLLSAAARGWGAADAATAEAAVRVQVPKLTTTIEGPSAVLVGRKAMYNVKVQNTGDVSVSDIDIKPSWPAGWRVNWPALNSAHTYLAPGQSSTVGVEVFPTTVGTATVSAEATGSRNTRSLGTCQTQVNGIAALRMELVDSVDPVEKGEQTTYEVRVTNTGTMADENVVVSCPLPEQFKLVSAHGPVGYAVQDLGTCTVVRFDPVRELAPKTDAVFKVTVKAVAAGDVRFKAHLTSRHLTTSVAKEESTRVYGD